MAAPVPRRHRLLLIALASAAVMLYEIGVTRVLSASLWYHFAFLAVSVAMLGIGVPGVWYALRGIGSSALERSLVVAAVAVPVSLAGFLAYPGPLPLRTALAATCMLVPLLALGSAVCVLLLEARPRDFGALYAADLLGACAAALAIVPLMHVVPTPLIVAGAGALPALGLWLLGGRAVALVLLVLIGTTLAWGAPYRVRHSKLYTDVHMGLVHERWTPTARLTVFSTPFWMRHPSAAFGWGFGKGYSPPEVEQMWLEQDGSAGTPITRLDRPPAELDYLAYDVTSLGLQLRRPDRVCIIGAGGGRDILTAVALGAREVDAVELNPAIIDLVSGRFGSFSGDVYHLPGVRPVAREGRSFLQADGPAYDLIEISMTDSWTATSAGAYALSENYLYTLEAYGAYWRRLTPDGMISTTRYVIGERLLETVRLAHLAVRALEREGVQTPWDHLAVVQADRIATVLASRAPLTGALLDSLESVCERRGFYVHWPRVPGAEGGIGEVLMQGPDVFAAQGIDLSPPGDDRPFFFHTVGMFAIQDPRTLANLSINDRAIALLRMLALLVGAFALVLFFLPFALRRAVPRGPGFWRGSVYFALIGLAFMAIEIPVIQRFILYLGHPSHATTVVLSSMLLGAGLGAAASGRLGGRALVAWGMGLLVVLVASNLAIGAWFDRSIGWPWWGRATFCFVVSGTMGFFMGVALPAGMARFGEGSRAWFWAVNGACGVFASISTLALAIAFGFSRVMAIGTLLYAAALAVLVFAPSLRRERGARAGFKPAQS